MSLARPHNPSGAIASRHVTFYVGRFMELNPASANVMDYSAENAATRAHIWETPALLNYWRSLQRNKWIVAAIVVASIAAALVLTLLATPLYSATTRLEISRQQENVTNVEGLQKEETGQSLEFYQTQYALLKSNSLVERVARSLNLANDEAFLEAYNIEDTVEAGAGRQSDSTNRLKTITGILSANVSIEPVRGSSLVDVTFLSPDPAVSAKVANAWAEQFIAASLDRRFASTREARDFLERQLAQLREKLEQSERDLVNYASDKRIIELSTTEGTKGDTRTERTLAAADLEALNEELASATGARIAAESAMRTSGGVSSATLTSPTINGLRQQRASLQSDYAKMLQQFEPAYPAAKAVKSQIDALDGSIAREESRVRGASDTGYREAVMRESVLRGKVEGLKSELIGERRDSIQYAIFQREVDTNRQLYDSLLQRYKEIGVAGVGSNNIAIVDRAMAPDGPSSPVLPLNLLLGLLAGLALSAGLLVVLEYLDQRLKDPQEVDRLLGIPLLGSVPLMRDLEIQVAIEDRKSEASESYFSIKTNLSFLTEHGVPRSFVLTSTAPNEGKTVSSYALATTLAKSGKRIVLIDADLRNPSMRKVLGMPASREGLANYLAGDNDIGELVHPTNIEGMSFIDTGPMPPNPAELLGGARMKQLVAQLQELYDHVVIDGPPILGIADAPLLSVSSEGVILTIESNRHKLRGIQSAVDRLRSARANILGAIVTKLD